MEIVQWIKWVMLEDGGREVLSHMTQPSAQKSQCTEGSFARLSRNEN